MKKRQTTTSGLEWNTMIGLTQRLKQDEHYKFYLLITIGSYFGLRISDLLSLRYNDVLNKEELIVTEQKTKKKRKITINQKVREAVNFCSNELRLKDKFKETDYIFSNRWGSPVTISYINKKLKFIFKKYNVSVQNGSSHTIRKTFGRRVYELDNKSERALVYLSEIFSHSSIAMTRKYIGITQEQISDIYMSL